MTESLGLIEVIGYPPAVEAADAALKAANVKLGALTRVDGGIVTVQILGDVGAVKAAVDAGASAASRIGTVRAAHVIPRLDSSLTGFLAEPGKGMKNLGQKNKQKDKNATTIDVSAACFISQEPSVPGLGVDVKENVPVVSDGIERAPLLEVDMTEVSSEGAYIATDLEKDSDTVLEVVQGSDTVSDTGPVVKRLSLDELKKLSNKELKVLIASLGIKMAAKKLKSAKKDELIQVITQFYKEGEN